MRTYKIQCEKSGYILGFEIESIYISPKKIAKLLSAIDGVTDIRVRELLASPRDVHVEFKYLDNDFVVWEPHGDNSRYWIVPQDSEQNADIDISPIENAFRDYHPPFLIKLLGDLISLNFKSLLHEIGEIGVRPRF